MFSCNLLLPPISSITLNTPNLTGHPYSMPFVNYLSNPVPDPTCVALSASSDLDLHHKLTIAAVTGHIPAAKVGGSCQKAPFSSSQAKGKCKAYDISDMELSASDDESGLLKMKGTHSSHRLGAENYSDDDMHC